MFVWCSWYGMEVGCGVVGIVGVGWGGDGVVVGMRLVWDRGVDWVGWWGWGCVLRREGLVP